MGWQRQTTSLSFREFTSVLSYTCLKKEIPFKLCRITCHSLQSLVLFQDTGKGICRSSQQVFVPRVNYLYWLFLLLQRARLGGRRNFPTRKSLCLLGVFPCISWKVSFKATLNSVSTGIFTKLYWLTSKEQSIAKKKNFLMQWHVGLDEQNNMLFKITSYLTWGKKKENCINRNKGKAARGKKHWEFNFRKKKKKKKKKTFLGIYFSKLQQPIRLCHIC